MKQIILYRATADNTGAFVDAGETLTIGEQPDARLIAAERAKELVESHGALDRDATATSNEG